MDPSRIPDLAAWADGDRPVFLFGGDGRLLWVNEAAALFWGAPSPAGVMASAGRFSAAGEQARDLARTLPSGQTRLERMRIVPFGRTVPLTSQVTRIALPDGERALLVVGMEGVSRRMLAQRLAAVPSAEPEPTIAAPDLAQPQEPASESAPAEAAALAEALATGLAAQPALAAPTEPVSIGEALAGALAADRAISDPFVAEAAEPVAPTADDRPAAEPDLCAGPDLNTVQDVPATTDTASVSPEPPSVPDRVALLRARTRPLRFTWLTSPAGRLIQISSEFAEAVGPEGLPREGETVLAFAARSGLTELVALMAQTVPWTGLRVAWPLTGAPERALVDLSGTMMPGGGVRGLGSFIEIVPVPPVAATEAPTAEAFTTEASTTEASTTDLAESAAPAVDAAPAIASAPLPEPEPAVEATTLAADMAAAQADDVIDGPPDVTPETDELPAAVADDISPAPAAEPSASAPPGAPANVLTFPGQKAASGAERKLDASDQAALRTIARVLGGPIAVPPAPEPTRPAADAPAAPAPVRADPSPTDAPGSRPAAAAAAAPSGGAAAMVMPSAFFLPVAPEPVAGPQAEPVAEVDDERLRALEAELALARQREAELSGIIDTAIDGVIVLDADGRIRSLNRSAQALFGLENSDVAGHPLTAVLALESHRTAIDYLDGLSRNGVASVLNDGREVVGVERKGGRIPLFMTIGRLGGEGAPGFCAVLRDVTQWKRAEQELIAARRQAENASNQKSDFLAKISHEIRTPLNAIIGFSEVMIEERFGRVENDRYRGYLADIRTSGEHLLSLVNDLLDLSKIEAGKLDLSFSAVRLGDLVQQAVATMQPQANREGVILRTSVPNTPPVVADIRSLRQILFNLLSNAIKFTRSGGQVILSTAMTDAGEVQLRVRDTGLGMTEAEIETALEPFRQIATRGRAQSEGTGLGLPLTKALAEANRATFQIESQPGEGTLVQITFPSTRVLAE